MDSTPDSGSHSLIPGFPPGSSWGCSGASAQAGAAGWDSESSHYLLSPQPGICRAASCKHIVTKKKPLAVTALALRKQAWLAALVHLFINMSQRCSSWGLSLLTAWSHWQMRRPSRVYPSKWYLPYKSQMPTDPFLEIHSPTRQLQSSKVSGTNAAPGTHQAPRETFPGSSFVKHREKGSGRFWDRSSSGSSSLPRPDTRWSYGKQRNPAHRLSGNAEGLPVPRQIQSTALPCYPGTAARTQWYFSNGTAARSLSWLLERSGVFTSPGEALTLLPL